MKRLLEPDRTGGFESWQSRLGGSNVLTPDLADIDKQDAVRPKAFARGLEMIGIVLHGAASDRAPSEFHRREIIPPRLLGASQCLLRRVTEELRRIWRFLVRRGVAEELPDRRIPGLSKNVPHGHLDAREGVGRLQQVHAVILDLRGDPGDIGRAVELLPEYGIADRSAYPMRHGADEARDGCERRRLALAPPHMSAR